jgi:UDP-N-acetylmuramoylalanine--D-glutamate ligase
LRIVNQKDVIANGDRVLVLGLGRSGRSAANFCAEQGARVVAVDEAEGAGELESLHEAVEVRRGEPFPDSGNFDWVIPSPGIPSRRYGGPGPRVLGDIELAARTLCVPIVAVTGTNGKTTTVALLEALLRHAGLRAAVAGNVGRPALSLVGEPLDVAILEVSSFQLEITQCFAPEVSVVLNVAADHLDRHGDLEAYTAAKRRLVEAQTPEATCVLNADDPTVAAFANATRAKVSWFGAASRTTDAARAAWVDGNAVVLRLPGGEQRIRLDGSSLSHRHDFSNAAAALLALAALEVDVSKAAGGLKDFVGLPHRCRPVALRAGVSWIDDSKATNVAAAEAALRGSDRPLLWIAGGRGKGLDFAPLAAAARGRVRRALLIGESAREIETSLAGTCPTLRCENLDAAVRAAADEARPGDAVLLSPACASFDQFRSYVERGESFQRAIAALDEGAGA